MIINGQALLKAAPIKDMSPSKNREFGLSWGLSEVGYDFRLQEKVTFIPPKEDGIVDIVRKIWNYGQDYQMTEEDKLLIHGGTIVENMETGKKTITIGRTALASSIEFFHIPKELWCQFKNKSTHARCFLDSSICTDGEPGWRGNLTIELVFHGMKSIVLEAGTPILKAVFFEIAEPAEYNGKYQDQGNEPVEPIFECGTDERSE